MYKIEIDTLRNAYKPFDVVTDEKGNVGFIQEVSCNTCQPTGHQISYAVNWIVGDVNYFAWWGHDELKPHCNLLIKIAECACHPMGNNAKFVKELFAATGK